MEISFVVLLGASTGLDVAVAIAALLATARRESGSRVITAPRTILSVLVAAASFVIKSFVLFFAGLNVFGLIHAAYLDLVIGAPVIAVALLATNRVAQSIRVTATTRALAAMCVVAAPISGIYATMIEPFKVQIERATVPIDRNRAGRERIRIGVLADIQTSDIGEHQHTWIDRMMAEAPDIILIPGDLLQAGTRSYEAQLPKMRELLGKLRAPGGVYFVSGDCEWRDGGRDILEGLGIVHLDNRVVRVTVRDRQVRIAGVELNCSSPQARAAIHELEQASGHDEIRILVSHRPDAVFGLQPDCRTDLLVCGHTHGGQVQVPWFGPFMTLTKVPRNVAAGGLHRMDGRTIYVSRGLGWEGGQAPRIRFLCPPEISILTLE